MTYKFSNLFEPTPIKMKVLGKALAAAASGAALLNTVNGGNAKISFALVAFAFIGTFLMEFFADAKPDVVQVTEKVATDIQDTAVYQQAAATTGLSNVSAAISKS
jgi:hypothetical protein